MKSIFKIILASFFLLSLQFCNAQQNEYFKFYNQITPKLQEIAKNKTQYYNGKFSDFNVTFQNHNVTIKKFGYGPKIFNSKDNYVLNIYFTDQESLGYASDHRYQFPIINITFTEKIPDVIKDLAIKYEGKWNNDMLVFFSNQHIEKIDFYGINGVTSSDRKGR